MQDLKFTEAEAGDVEQIIQVVNAAYRGETSKLGWTTEADLLDGLRTDEKELLQLLTDEASCILLCKTQDTVLGSVHLQYMGDCVEIGMFAVNPLHQGRGIGKQLLQHAESIAIKTWSIQRLQMVVISCRYELSSTRLSKQRRYQGFSRKSVVMDTQSQKSAIYLVGKNAVVATVQNSITISPFLGTKHDQQTCHYCRKNP